jgi:hypothetical protein
VWVWVSWLERGGWGTFLLLLLLLLLPLLVLRRRSRTVRASLRISALLGGRQTRDARSSTAADASAWSRVH